MITNESKKLLWIQLENINIYIYLERLIVQVLSGNNENCTIIEFVTKDAIIYNGDISFNEKLAFNRIRKIFIGSRNSELLPHQLFKIKLNYHNSIMCINKLKETGCLYKGKSRGRPSIKNAVWKTFVKI